MAFLLALLALAAACTTVESQRLLLQTVEQCLIPENGIFDFRGLTQVPGPNQQRFINGSFAVVQTINSGLNVSLTVMITPEPDGTVQLPSTVIYRTAFPICEELKKNKTALQETTQGRLLLSAGIKSCPIAKGTYYVKDVRFADPSIKNVVEGAQYDVTLRIRSPALLGELDQTCLRLTLLGQ